MLGTPIAGYLLLAAGGNEEDGGRQNVSVYRPAIFYAGGVAALSSLFVLTARAMMTKKLVKKV